jgi:hypothetical protein
MRRWVKERILDPTIRNPISSKAMQLESEPRALEALPEFLRMQWVGIGSHPSLPPGPGAWRGAASTVAGVKSSPRSRKSPWS